MNLSQVDLSTLSEKEQAQLFPFYSAYTRPYPILLTRKDLKVEGEGGYFRKTNTLDEIKHQAKMLDTMYFTWLQTVERDSNGDIVDVSEQED